MMARAMSITDNGRLARIAPSLGADVPFFLDPRPCRVGGIGERITPIAGIARMPIVLGLPPFEVSTAGIFSRLKPSDWSGPADEADIDAIVRGEIAPTITINDLSTVAMAQFPQIRRLKELLEQLGARASQMSGSGGSVFGVFGSEEDAEKAATEARAAMPDVTVLVATTLGSDAPKP
jgi:4-diphosphocytidyl-2-C-methyl-D-erythritol kinase